MNLSEGAPEIIEFECNICTQKNRIPIEDFSREGALCSNCRSSPRSRAIAYVVSIELFGENLCIQEFHGRENMRGIGMSDWQPFADVLEKSLDYTNTFFDTIPRLDIMDDDFMKFPDLDFIVSSEVFEHIAPPAQRAFDNLAKMLKSGGTLVFSAPFLYGPEPTVERFPNLYKYKVIDFHGRRLLLNQTVEKHYEVLEGLIFHTEGTALEIRQFSLPDLMTHLKESGFVDIKIYEERVLERGIYWPQNASHVISAKMG